MTNIQLIQSIRRNINNYFDQLERNLNSLDNESQQTSNKTNTIPESIQRIISAVNKEKVKEYCSDKISWDNQDKRLWPNSFLAQIIAGTYSKLVQNGDTATFEELLELTHFINKCGKNKYNPNSGGNGYWSFDTMVNRSIAWVQSELRGKQSNPTPEEREDDMKLFNNPEILPDKSETNEEVYDKDTLPW